MITSNTVFVLGAGASAPYGFPLGGEVRQLICQAVDPASSLARTLVSLDYHPDEVLRFARGFQNSNIATIDAYLSRRDEQVELGKVAIASVLCRAENPESLAAVTPDEDWYGLLWNAMLEDVEHPLALHNNKAKFVTFNYDRSLEYFLFTSIMHTFHISEPEAMQVLSRIPICHVYGQLGEFSYLASDTARPYAPDTRTRELAIAAAGISIIPEARDDAPVFERVGEWLDQASYVCFLGFGFDRLNVARLRLGSVIKLRARNPLPGAQVIGIAASTLGMNAQEVEIARERLYDQSALVRWRPIQANCRNTLRQTRLLHDGL